MPKTSNPEQQAARRKLMIAIQRIKPLEDLILLLAIVEQMEADPDLVRSAMGVLANGSDS